MVEEDIKKTGGILDKLENAMKKKEGYSRLYIKAKYKNLKRYRRARDYVINQANRVMK